MKLTEILPVTNFYNLSRITLLLDIADFRGGCKQQIYRLFFSSI
jgi:hypothetical protein